MSQDPTLAPWIELQKLLGGYFLARTRELLGLEFVLSSTSGGEFGRMRVRGEASARLETGSTKAEIERTARSRYRMLTGGAQTLVAQPARNRSGGLEISCVDRLYDARVNLVRNIAVARSSGGEEAVRLAGGLTNRSYEANFDAEDEGSLPVAIFLLYHTVALRRRAFLAGAKT